MNKRADLIADLTAGWCAVPEILAQTGWKPHTLRGLLSTMSRKDELNIERKRENGVTSYRITPA